MKNIVCLNYHPLVRLYQWIITLATLCRSYQFIPLVGSLTVFGGLFILLQITKSIKFTNLNNPVCSMTCLTLYMIRNPVCISVSYKVDIQTSFWYNSCNFDYLCPSLAKWDLIRLLWFWATGHFMCNMTNLSILSF